MLTLDSVAAAMAARAGIAWQALPDHPGYAKGCWRDAARFLIHRFAPGARIITGRREWGGRSAGYVVIGLTPAKLTALLQRSSGIVAVAHCQ